MLKSNSLARSSSNFIPATLFPLAFNAGPNIPIPRLLKKKETISIQQNKKQNCIFIYVFIIFSSVI